MVLLKGFVALAAFVSEERHINSRGGRRWWFVLHDDEGVLCSLESQRSFIKL